MAPKEPTRHQLSSRLAYSQDTPRFLQRLKNKMAGQSNDDGDVDDDFDEWQAESGRPPIPRRPTPPERPDGNAGSADEGSEDEKPQIVVLKEGKHMSELEVENEKRKARGLPPLPSDSSDTISKDKINSAKNEKSTSDEKDTKHDMAPLSFSSGGPSAAKSGSKKRKAVGDGLEGLVKEKEAKGKKNSKAKKVKSGALLSFGDGEDG